MLIGKNWKLESDELNVTLFKRRTAKKGIHEGEDIWTPEAYHPTVESALKAMVRMGIKGSGMADLKTVVEKIDELHKLITKVAHNRELKKINTREKQLDKMEVE